MAQNVHNVGAEKAYTRKWQMENSNPMNMVPEFTLNISSQNTWLITCFMKILIIVIIYCFAKCGCAHLTVYNSQSVGSKIWDWGLLDRQTMAKLPAHRYHGSRWEGSSLPGKTSGARFVLAGGQHLKEYFEDQCWVTRDWGRHFVGSNRTKTRGNLGAYYPYSFPNHLLYNELGLVQLWKLHTNLRSAPRKMSPRLAWALAAPMAHIPLAGAGHMLGGLWRGHDFWSQKTDWGQSSRYCGPRSVFGLGLPAVAAVCAAFKQGRKSWRSWPLSTLSRHGSPTPTRWHLH